MLKKTQKYNFTFPKWVLMQKYIFPKITNNYLMRLKEEVDIGCGFLCHKMVVESVTKTHLLHKGVSSYCQGIWLVVFRQFFCLFLWGLALECKPLLDYFKSSASYMHQLNRFSCSRLLRWWSLFQVLLCERQGTSWTGCLSITGL